VVFNGKVQEAIDRHILDLKSLNGMQRWYLGSREILPVQYGLDPRKVLDDELSSKWYMYADDINAALDHTNIGTNLANAENDEHFKTVDAVIETPSEMSAEAWTSYQELKKDEIKLEKVKKYLDTDLSNPGLHALTRKAAESVQEEIALYKQGLKQESI
jgi:hypothetical protein